MANWSQTETPLSRTVCAVVIAVVLRGTESHALHQAWGLQLQTRLHVAVRDAPIFLFKRDPRTINAANLTPSPLLLDVSVRLHLLHGCHITQGYRWKTSAKEPTCYNVFAGNYI